MKAPGVIGRMFKWQVPKPLYIVVVAVFWAGPVFSSPGLFDFLSETARAIGSGAIQELSIFEVACITYVVTMKILFWLLLVAFSILVWFFPILVLVNRWEEWEF